MKTIKNRKTLSAIIVALLTTVIGGSVLVYNFVLADRRLPGLDRLIQEKTSATETFQILEIVEDKGEIGFYFDGNEPFSKDEYGYALDFETTLSNIASASEREAYVNELVGRLNKGTDKTKWNCWTDEATGTPADYPISYNKYSETYFPTDESAWKYVEFDGNKYVEIKGEYVEVQQPADGSTVYGDYSKNSTYKIAYDRYDEATDTHHYNGDYVENLAGFDPDSTEKSYRVTFGTEKNNLGLGVYLPKYDSAGAVSTQAAFDALKEQNNGKYWIDVNGSYVEIDMNDYVFADSATETDVNVLAKDTVLYTLSYKYAGTTDDESGKTYYYVQSYSYAYDGLEYDGEYGPILKNGEGQYVSCEPGKGTHKLSKYDYSYTPGMGGYNFVPDDTKTVQQVEMRGFYYKGGFVNNNWFRSKVFLSSEENIDLNLFPVRVRTLTVDELVKECTGNVGVFNETDLLVINGSATMFDNADASVLSNVAGNLRSQIEVNKLATVVNTSLVNGNSNSAMVKLLQEYYKTKTLTSIGSADKNIYWYTGSLFNKSFGTYLDDEEVPTGFQQVLDYIETENKYISLREGEELLSKKVSQSVVMQYILSCKYARNIAPKSTLSVLEIQPCADYELTPSEVKKITGYDQMSDDAIEIVQMTTAEFVGKIHDLNGAYDFIYFGMRTGKMNLNSGTKETIYNDSTMNGFVYTHTGDAVIAAERLTGLLNTDFVDNNTSNLPYSRDVYKIRLKKNSDGKLEFDPQTIPTFSINTPGKSQVTKSVQVGNQGVYRYSGNDITAENIEQLMDYVNAGYPVILANNFAVAGTTNDKKTASSINTTKIDNSSYLYDFLEESFAKDNVYLKNDALSSDESLKFYLNLPKLQLTFYEEANEGSASDYYIENNDVTDHYADDTEEFVKKDSGKYYLTYVFSIKDEASASVLDTNYKVNLFVDINSDGKYSRDHEMMKDIKVTDAESGESVAYDELVANKKYIVTRRIPDAFRSIVPWKLEVSLAKKETVENGTTSEENTTTEVTSNDLGLIRKSQIGYSKLETNEKTEIQIYQILCDPKGNNRDNNTWNLEEDYSNSNSQFRADILSVDEYDLEFTTDYVKGYQARVASSVTNQKKAYYDYLSQYDMIIIGFADVYEGFTNKYAVEAILQFIEDGKTVLFTHDTTSFVNYKGDTADNVEGEGFLFWDNSDEAIGGDRWGYLLNYIVRDKLGMDRYGITNPDKFIKGADATASAADGLTTDEAKILVETLLKQGKILDTTQKVKTYMPDCDYTGTVAELIALAKKEVAYVAGSNKTQAHPETQGYTYTTINSCVKLLGDNEYSYKGDRWTSKDDINGLGTHTEYMNLNSSSGVTNLGKTWAQSLEDFFANIVGTDSWLGQFFQSFANWLGGIFDKYLGSVHNGSFDKMEISQVNKGQITEYPFKIDEKLSVASTHAQYYQLDLAADQDNDGESDIVVWYCISDGYNGNNKGAANPYSASPNDVRNNYYIYSIGNVFYTGAGHKSVNQAEKRLFINTMIAAYNASVNEPSVTVLESENISAAELSSMNMPMEYSLASEGQKSYIGDTTIKIPYSVYDDNFVYASDTVKKLSVEYFIEDSNGDTTINGVKVKKLNNITTTQNDKSVSKIESGKAYTAVWEPTATELYKYISNDESVHIYIRVKAEFVYNGEPTTLYGHDTLALKKTNMFELD